MYPKRFKIILILERFSRTAYFLTLCGILFGCNSKVCTDPTGSGNAIYARCLSKYETVAKDSKAGPFTSLQIRYDEPGLLGGAHYTYHRILHNGQVIVKKAEDVQQWTGTSSRVFLADVSSSDLSANGLHLIHENAGRPVVQQIEIAKAGWVADYEYRFGYPLNSNLRYFPRYVGANDAGFLLSADPLVVKQLPEGPRGVGVPWIQSLAAISPDFRSFAYTDSRVTPSAIVVVDADGNIHEPIPIPFTSLRASSQPGAHSFDPARVWFAASFTWVKDGRGNWNIVPKRNHNQPKQRENPVEHLFVDAVTGYQNCFASSNPMCLKGWRALKDGRELLDDCCMSRYAYAPVTQLKAFDANVVALVYGASITSGSGYYLLLDAAPEQVIAALAVRLNRQKVPFVRADRCPRTASDDAECIASLKEKINWQDPDTPDFLSGILRMREKGAVFMTPTAAVAVYPRENGGTWVATVARYNNSPTRKRERDTNDPRAKSAFHRS